MRKFMQQQVALVVGVVLTIHPEFIIEVAAMGEREFGIGHQPHRQKLFLVADQATCDLELGIVDGGRKFSEVLFECVKQLIGECRQMCNFSLRQIRQQNKSSASVTPNPRDGDSLLIHVRAVIGNSQTRTARFCGSAICWRTGDSGDRIVARRSD